MYSAVARSLEDKAGTQCCCGRDSLLKTQFIVVDVKFISLDNLMKDNKNVNLFHSYSSESRLV